MSLDNINLSPFLVEELYKNSLVDIDSLQPETEVLETSDFIFLGKNEKNIIVLVRDASAMHVPDEDLNFLVGILTACKLSLSDIAIVNLATNKGVTYESLVKNLKPGIILFFGVEPSSLEFPLEFPHYQLQSYNKQTYLSAPSLQQLAADKQQKLQLWTCLKKLFSI